MSLPASRQSPAATPIPSGTPWQNGADGEQESEMPWLMSYLDFMTVLVVLFVCLYAGEKIHSRVKAQASAPAKVAQAVVRPPAKPAAAVVTAEPMVAVAPVVVAAVPEPQPPLQPEQALQPVVPAPPAEMPAPPAAVAEAAPAPASAAPETATVPAEAPVAALPAIPEQLADRVRVSRDAQKVLIEVNDAVLFQAGRAELSEEGKAVLNALQPALLAHPGAITVEGHTDDRPIATAQYPSNWELSAVRASVVTRHLIGLGVPANRVRPVGHADTQPRADNATAEGRAQNRRVSLVLHGE